MKLSEPGSMPQVVGILGILFSVAMFNSCSPADIQAGFQAVQDGVTALENNKSLAEQFVRDVKSSYEPGDPQYRTVMGQ
jgi:hypothetical protein